MPIHQTLDHCVFCQIIKRIHPSFIIHETAHTLAILDIFPFANGHTLVLSKRCVPNIQHLTATELLEIQQVSQRMIVLIDQKLMPGGYNLVNNYNEIAGQMINHYHLHIIPKYSKDSGFQGQKLVNQTTSLKDVKQIWKELTQNANANSRQKL